MHVTFSWRVNNFWQNYDIFNFENFEIRLQYDVASLCNQLYPGFSSNQFETLHRCYKFIEDVHVTFCRRKNNFWQSFGIFDLDKFEVSLQHRGASLCNQFLPEFSSNQFETLHRCYIEDMHVTFCRRGNICWQNYGISDLDNFEVRLQYGVAILWNQHLSEFSSIQIETLHKYCKHIEDVHVTFAHKNIIYDKITAIFWLTFQTLHVVFSINWIGWGVIGGDLARGSD